MSVADAAHIFDTYKLPAEISGDRLVSDMATQHEIDNYVVLLEYGIDLNRFSDYA